MDYQYIYEATNEWNPPCNCSSVVFKYFDQVQVGLLSFPPSVVELAFHECDIDHLDVPEGINWLLAEDLGLKSIKLPASSDIVYLNDNRIKLLELPPNIGYIEAKNNKLVSVVVQGNSTLTNLKYLNVENNSRLTTIDFEPAPCVDLILKHDKMLQLNTNLKKAKMKTEF
jgi:hypothetical protein